MTDFASLVATPEGAAAWAAIQGQLSAEGADGLALLGAKDTLVTSFTQLTTGALKIDPGDALKHAQDFTMAAQTVAGAVSTVQGLIQMGSSASTLAQDVAAANAITGTLIAAAVSLGAVSAGAGALVVAGVGMALDVLSEIGLFGGPPAAAVLCGGNLSAVPTIVAGCAFSTTAQPNAVGARLWRSFPDASSGWFGQAQPTGFGGYVGTVTWLGDLWITVINYSQRRLIDMALPDYAAIERGQPASGDISQAAKFKRAHFNAWKSNKAYAFNGLKVQDDWQVFILAVQTWNRAHSDSTHYDIGPADTLFPFEASLFSALGHANLSDVTSYIDGKIRLFTGPMKNAAPIRKIVLPLKLSPGLASMSDATSATPIARHGLAALSTWQKIAVGLLFVGAAAAGVVGVWAWRTHQSYGKAWGNVWGKTGGKLTSRLHLGRKKNPLRLTAGESSKKTAGKPPTTIQTLLFPKTDFDVRQAKRWARQHGHVFSKVDTSGNFIRLRQASPAEFQKRSFRTITLPGTTVKAVVAHRK